MWKFLTILPIKAKIFTILVFIFIIFFGLVFLGIYWENKTRILQSSDERMYAHLKDLEDIFALHKKNQEHNLSQGMRWGNDQLKDAGELKENPNKRFITNIIDAENDKVLRVELTEWLLNSKSFHFDSTLVDKIEKNIKCNVSILQIIPDGLVRIATTNRNSNKSRAVRTFISSKSLIYQKIIKNQTFNGRIKIANNWYLTYYYPIYSKGKLIGALGISTPEKELGALKSIMNNHTYLKSGFGYVMDKDGEVLIHKSKSFEGTNFQLVNPKFYKWLISHKERAKERYFINLPPSKKFPKGLAEWRWQYFKYFEPYNIYIAIVISEKEFFEDALNSLAQLMLFSLLVTIIGAILLINILINPIFKPLQQINNTLNEMSFGKTVLPLKIIFFDEVGKIAQSLNQVIQALATYSSFVKEVGVKNFDADFKALSPDDTLGNVLLEMAQKLQDNEIEIKKRTWIAEGNAMLGAVMRKNTGKINLLLSETLKHLLEYTNAQQGGIFLVDKNNENPQLNLVACYAYQREKILQKVLDAQTGFLGQVLESQKTIIIENLPKNYSELITGTEKLSLNYLIAIPLKIQNDVIGVIEILSFKKFQPFEIQFLENFTESLTATIIVEQSNHATLLYMKQIQETAEMLAQQDEEMRQNMEELRAMQDTSQNKEKEIEKLLLQSKENEKELQNTLEEMKKMEVQMYIQRTSLEKELDNALIREKNLLAENSTLKNK
jgi:hypothetical protein